MYNSTQERLQTMSNDVQLKIMIPKTVKREFQVACTLNDTTMTQVIGDYILAYLKENKEVA